ncbi:conjugal transfer protein TrbB [Mycolicibacterium canariasense]|uniref:conjugal transfer protein TrbB n=1 Tax=Mycolicibacterium canariasense TaxID=228230 RepID=UPI000D6DBA0F|nr:conjugal transfer protein TrbB [Mycolicibacterium canariasense]MCV7208318.1 conjugal transfer protein TrbB [Mycolicibacterium canariasense]
MVLHVQRTVTGRRRLHEIAVLGRAADGWVSAATAWHADDGFGPGASALTRLLDDRSRR